MRRRRSSFATTRISPSSTFLRPIFQASATRIEYCSISSGLVVGSSSTAIWLPRRDSKAAMRGFEFALLLGVQRSGEIRDARLERRNRDLGARGAEQIPPATISAAQNCRIGTARYFAAGLLKSTFGGAAIAFSSSTVKLAFVL